MRNVLQSRFFLTLIVMLLSGCAGFPNDIMWKNSEQVRSEIVVECRALFPDVYNNPSSVGGIALVSARNTKVLCLYGSLKGVDSQYAARYLLKSNAYSYVVVRSSGGSVQTWLSLAEALVGRVENVLVDELCMSSCANYIFPIGRNKLVSLTSLTVWHGGPTVKKVSLDPVIKPETALNSQTPLLKNYALRTEKLYRQVNINPEILQITSNLSLSPSVKQFIKQYNHPNSTAISGYAIPPRVLSRCFGFLGLERMSHLGNIDKVYKLGRSKSSNLNIIVLPAFYDPKLCKLVSKHL